MGACRTCRDASFCKVSSDNSIWMDQAKQITKKVDFWPSCQVFSGIFELLPLFLDSAYQNLTFIVD